MATAQVVCYNESTSYWIGMLVHTHAPFPNELPSKPSLGICSIWACSSFFVDFGLISFAVCTYSWHMSSANLDLQHLAASVRTFCDGDSFFSTNDGGSLVTSGVL